MSMDPAVPVAASRSGGNPFQLAMAQVDGSPRILVRIDGAFHALDEVMSPHVRLPGELFEVLGRWDRWHPSITDAVGRLPRNGRGVEPERWLLPVRPSKLICIGTNYHDHVREMGTSGLPAFPYAFLKPVSTGLSPSGAAVGLPRGSRMVDWEAELAVVIRRHPEKTDASILDCVAGYTVYNDLSARDWIVDHPDVGIDWVMMKAYDGFSPIGPLFTPAEFVPDVQNLPVRSWVNGEIKQDSNTSEMIFDVAAILRHLAGIMTLEPGDVVATGTPLGVGYGARPQQFLQDGDTVTVEVEGLGRLESHMADHFEGESQ